MAENHVETVLRLEERQQVDGDLWDLPLLDTIVSRKTRENIKQKLRLTSIHG